MLLPDVTAILYDPEIGGGQAFQVIRTTGVRSRSGYTQTPTYFNATGNVQPQELSNQSSTAEDLLNESIVIYSTFSFQVGSNSVESIIEADIVIYDNKFWRVTRVNDWSKWGCTTAYATRIRDMVAVPPAPHAADETEGPEEVEKIFEDQTGTEG